MKDTGEMYIVFSMSTTKVLKWDGMGDISCAFNMSYLMNFYNLIFANLYFFHFCIFW